MEEVIFEWSYYTTDFNDMATYGMVLLIAEILSELSQYGIL